MRQDSGHDGGRPTAETIRLAARRAGRMNFASLRTLRAYWEAQRDGRDMPTRAEIDPRGIENALADAFIAERIAPGILRLRVAGTRLNDFMGMEVRGMPLTALIEPEARSRFSADVERVFSTPAIAEFALHADAAFGRPALDGQLLLLPLHGSDGAISRVLGGFAFEGRIGRAPRRVEPMQIRLTPISDASNEMPEVDRAPHESGFAEPTVGFHRAPPAQGKQRRGAPYLRLVKSD